MLPYIKILRLPNLLLLALAMCCVRFFLIGGWLNNAEFYFKTIETMRPIRFTMSNNLFALLVTSSVLIAAAGYIINDYFDMKSDNVNRPGSNKVGKGVSRRMAMLLHVVLNVAGLLIGLYLAWQCKTWKLVGIQLFTISALWFYSSYLKKSTGFGELVLSFLIALMPISVYLYEYYFGFGELSKELNSMVDPEALAPTARLGILPMVILGYAALAFLTDFIRQNFKDLDNMVGDRQTRNRTLAVTWGETNTRNLALILSIVVFCIIALFEYVMWNWGLKYTLWYAMAFVQLPLMVSIVIAMRARAKKQYTILSRLLYVIMVAGVLSMPVLFFDIKL
ncbi:MAG: geranylgeranylglycerol-phosphate geranylgeranyltransferase [Sphingobacteriales bacterium JAD_PAG50586_3]|nr:MAG: geranylgeranylglycerol-phosphate geranylgeranyltransferase [Sphingobacteriales bacterium JAD_PAG50586_3]